MTISHASYDFGSPLHGVVGSASFDIPVLNQGFFGVIGEIHLIGQRMGRILEIDATIQDVASEVAIQTIITEIGEHQGEVGTLIVNSGNFARCTFLGFEQEAPPFFDGSGVHDWVCFGKLRFRQIAA